MLTAFSESERVFSALKAGAVGYLLKNVSPDEICATVERAAEGEPMLSGEIAGRVLREFERERARSVFASSSLDSRPAKKRSSSCWPPANPTARLGTGFSSASKQ